MQFNSIISAIPREWKDFLHNAAVDTGYKLMFDKLHKMSSRNIYSKLIEDPSTMDHLKTRWENKLNYGITREKFQDVFFDIYTNVPCPKLRSFQFRFVHRRIFLNEILYKWKIVDTARCFYCENEYETMEHLFIHCTVTSRFWELLQNWFECATDTVVNLTPLDIALCQTNDRTLNTILICAKQFIFKRRIQEKFINFYIFKDELKLLAKFEKKWAYQQNTKSGWVRFNKKWNKIGFARLTC